MLVVCIDNNNTQRRYGDIHRSHTLTIHKIYEVIKTSYINYYYIENDYGSLSSYDPSFFIPLQEFRDNQLNNIIDE